MSVDEKSKKKHDSYVVKLADMLERQGYKVITEGSIPEFRGKEWGEPDIFALKKAGLRLSLQKIVGVSVSDKKEGKAPNTLLNKCRKMKEYYNPPEIIVFEPTNFTSKYYEIESIDNREFENYDQVNAYLREKWKEEGLNITFWNEKDLEERKTK